MICLHDILIVLRIRSLVLIIVLRRKIKILHGTILIDNNVLNFYTANNS